MSRSDSAVERVVLVTGGGSGIGAATVDTSLEVWRRVHDINLDGRLSMPFFQELVATHGDREAAWSALASQTPLGRFASAAEVTAAIAYLCSDDAALVTGTELVLDGGYTA